MDLRNKHGKAMPPEVVVVAISPQAAQAIAAQVLGSIAAAFATVLGMKIEPVTPGGGAAAPSNGDPSSS